MKLPTKIVRIARGTEQFGRLTGSLAEVSAMSNRICARTRQQLATVLVSPLLLLAATSAASAATTGLTGGNQPSDNLQPSLALNYIIATQGIFPSTGGGGFCGISSTCIGQISTFAGTFAPSGWEFAKGQLLPIAQNTAIISYLVGGCLLMVGCCRSLRIRHYSLF